MQTQGIKEQTEAGRLSWVISVTYLHYSKSFDQIVYH